MKKIKKYIIAFILNLIVKKAIGYNYGTKFFYEEHY